MRNSTRLALVLFFMALASGCDSDGATDDVLAPGEFVATVTGHVERQLHGDAFFALSPYSPSQEMVSLQFRSGTFRPPGRHSDMDLGVFLSFAWDSLAGSYEVSTAGEGLINGAMMLASEQPLGLPTPFDIESGTVTVSEATAYRMAGTFAVVAVALPALEVYGVRHEVEVRGEFVAEPVPQE